MSVVSVVIGQDHPALRKKAVLVEKFDKNLKKLVVDLLDTVGKEQGVGLSAPQIDVNKCVLVGKIGSDYLPMVNPVIIWKSDTVEVGEEGCLSLPDIWLMIPRVGDIVVKYFDPKGNEKERKLSGFDARIVQHEVDHLDGVLIIDY